MTPTRNAGRQLAVGQGVQAVRVNQHAARLVKGANHVLAQRVVHARLAAHRRVHLHIDGERSQCPAAACDGAPWSVGQGAAFGRGLPLLPACLQACLHRSLPASLPAIAACQPASRPCPPPLPPPLTWDMTVVGTWIKCTPRWYAAAANPVMSPITPPPRAMKVVLRSSLGRTRSGAVQRE